MHFLSETPWQTYAMILFIKVITYISNFQLGYQTGVLREIPFTEGTSRSFFRQKRIKLLLGSFLTTSLSCAVLYFFFLQKTSPEYRDDMKVAATFIVVIITVMAYHFGKKKHASHPHDWEKDIKKHTIN
jgi:hypothetical protein